LLTISTGPSIQFIWTLKSYFSLHSGIELLQLFCVKMPLFQVTTNIPKSSVPSSYLKETTALLAKMLGKPESYCVASVIPDQMMMWGGEEGPCAIAVLMSIGKLGVQENKEYSRILSEHVQKQLGVSPDRMYIEFQDAQTSQLGYNRTTFHEIMGK